MEGFIQIISSFIAEYQVSWKLKVVSKNDRNVMKEKKMDQEIEGLFNAILKGDAELTKEKVRTALEKKIDSSRILNDGMIAAMSEVGERFDQHEYFLPEMLVAARAMQQGLAILKPHLQGSELQSGGKVILGTVKGDLHDIGKNLVGKMLEGAGFEVHDLGTDVPADKFVDSARMNSANIVAMSALLTTTMPSMKTVIKAIEDAGLRSIVKVIIGGAPVTESYAKEIGADGYSSDASRAVKLVKSLLAK